MRGRTDPAARASSLRADAEALRTRRPAAGETRTSHPPRVARRRRRGRRRPARGTVDPSSWRRAQPPASRRADHPLRQEARGHQRTRAVRLPQVARPGHPSLVSAAEPPLRLVPWTQRHPGRVPASSWDCDEPAGLRRAATGCRKPSPGCSRSRLSSASPSSGPLGSAGPGPGGTESEPMVEGPGSRAAVRPQSRSLRAPGS